MSPLFVGAALGAAAMYFLDPHEGRRRRARTRDRVIHAGRRVNEASRVTARDTVHRAYGAVAGARRLLRHEKVRDAQLVERVRAELGRVVSHPHAIDVSAEDGRVTLSGPILSGEARPLLRCARQVAGVKALDDRLTVYEASDAQHVSSLQGGVPRPGARFELLQENWSPAARLAVAGFGAGLVVGAFRAGAFGGSLLGLAGGTLLARAAANRSFPAMLGMADASRGIVVQKTMNVDAPVERVFSFWSDYRSFPRFMRFVREVHVRDDVSHWVVAGPAGVSVQWNAKLVEVRPNSLLRWRSMEGSEVKHEGWVRFEPNGDGGTRVTVHLSYVPPGGAFGHALASLFGVDPKSEMDADLMRMKSAIETGHAPHDAAQPA